MTRRRETIRLAAMMDSYLHNELSIDDIIAMCDDRETGFVKPSAPVVKDPRLRLSALQGNGQSEIVDNYKE